MTSSRLWAVAALLIGLATIVLTVVVTVEHFPKGLTVLACLILAIAAAAWAVVRHGLARVLGFGVAALLLAGAVAVVVLENFVLEDLLILGGVGATLAAARLAFQARAKWPLAAPPEHAVLFYNPLSGGGKAQKFRLADEARKRRIEPIELRRGEDLELLVRAAVERGADALAMAGGDGSQAIVARLAAEFDLPYACIPAGTRNHFALDLGVDRDDVVGALDALVNGGERRVDLAEVNGRVFVNNVSLGLYAEAVQRPGYREAKLHTLLDTVPDAVGPESQPPELQWRGPTGQETAVAILVSNNPYRLGRLLGSGTRPRLDRGILGIAVLLPLANGPRPPKLKMEQWTAPRFEIEGGERVPAGIDGEAVILEQPVHFLARPAALRVRIAPGHPGASPSALEPDKPWQAVAVLARLALRGASPEMAAG